MRAMPSLPVGRCDFLGGMSRWGDGVSDRDLSPRDRFLRLGVPGLNDQRPGVTHQLASRHQGKESEGTKQVPSPFRISHDPPRLRAFVLGGATFLSSSSGTSHLRHADLWGQMLGGISMVREGSHTQPSTAGQDQMDEISRIDDAMLCWWVRRGGGHGAKLPSPVESPGRTAVLGSGAKRPLAIPWPPLAGVIHRSPSGRARRTARLDSVCPILFLFLLLPRDREPDRLSPHLALNGGEHVDLEGAKSMLLPARSSRRVSTTSQRLPGAGQVPCGVKHQRVSPGST